ncbi:nonribosomal peptide synthase SidD [Coniochaeta ligniaria NRRL 30616]|uniref:Nonribosomal peptide synthase SidD n=1 Tax=Coniochaeta ligniaria NRRL 30616 TaxID=1408157 RepID=A0A1J7JN20_9PEZI|nr:nonribosomal peptide synthase SidD [Coniochaeta ligniaria NRRL 30616]
MGSTTDYHYTGGDGFRSFEVAGLATEQHATPTGMREDLLLLSWLIVLLRTREDGQASYDWAYAAAEDGEVHEPVNRRLSTDQVMTSLQSKVGEVAAAISRQIATQPSSPCRDLSTPASLVLSTGSLSRTSEGAKDEGVLHIEVRFGQSHLEIRPIWRSPTILDYTERRYIETLVDTVEMCISNLDASIEEYIRPTTHDLDTIWEWNHELPPTYDFCMQDMIAEWAEKSSDKVAIDSWDGTLTYGQIERDSTFLAGVLRESGVELHDFLPVCFEKSRWTIVAVLAVMKAGATIVMMDPTLPLARLQNMAKQVGAKTMISSRMQHDLARSILPDGNHFTVEADTFAHLSVSDPLPDLPPVPASALMYIIFTSGSTGTPKGVKISHSTYTSSAIPRAKAVGYTEESRVLDFASYAFDVSIDSMLLTLGNGGCLCIPSDEDRLNDINGVIRRMRVNYAGITPSVARILDPEVIASLHGLGLGGEAVSARDATLWGRDTRIIIGYGPCECTIGCTVNSSAATGRDYISIGPGNGAAMWIVHPDNHEVLMPVGAVGELLVEGPIVGQGYLNDPEKTAAAFIHDPSWLVAGHKSYPGRRGRLYKTGDLGKFDPDGSGGIVFVGRKDTQVKLRGQRVELGEIESQLKDRLPPATSVIAEVIVPKGAGGQKTLVAFIAPQSNDGTKLTEIELAQPSDELRATLSKVDAELEEVLPRYMIPTAYITVNYIPTLISGKTDRKRLRQFGTNVDLRELGLDQDTPGTASRELSDLELRLREAWGVTLNLDPDSIRPNDHFFALGGDSLAAMRLVPVCRERGLDLSVTKTFDNPTLSAMARVVLICDTQTKTETPAFCMVSRPVEEACEEAARACRAEPTAIKDIYPCTPTQESLFTFSLKSTKAYVAQRLAVIPSGISLEAWKSAWEAVATASPILRTRLVQVEDPGLQQVVLKEGIHWRQSTDLAQYLEDDRNERMNLGESLARYAIVDDSNDGKRYMVWTVHHVLYDGWSEPLILDNVQKALANQPVETHTEIRDFVKWMRDADEAESHEYWRRELKGAVGPQFPRLPSRDFLPAPDSIVERQISLATTTGLPFTVATLIRGAWALVASQYTSSDDVLFGETLTGRDIALPGVEHILGPLNATVPVRVHVDRGSSVLAYLQAVQQCISARTPYQHIGWQNIRKISADAQHACEAGTGLVIQPEEAYAGELGFRQEDAVREALHFNPYPLMVACGLRKGGFRVCASFDSSLIEVGHMERILAQLETACVRLMKDLDRSVGQISCLPETELSDIWRWNEVAPLHLDESSRKLRADASTKQGAVYPRAVVPWVCDPRNPDFLSPIGCPGELWLEGALVTGDDAKCPAWLVAGSDACRGRTGSVQPTGDMVESREDGTLIYLGRKEDIVPVQGHAVDLAGFEAQLARHLAPSVRSAAALFQPSSGSTDKELERELIVFIELPSSDGVEDYVAFMSSNQDISWASSDAGSFTTTLCATVPISLAAALKKFDKYVQNSLTSHSAPSAYVVVDKLPTKDGQVDHSRLNQLASEIPRSVLDQLRDGFKEACQRSLLEADLTVAEAILRSSWAKILGMRPEQIEVDDNFFRLGGDSVLAMKLVSSLRAQGHALSVADVFQHMRLGDAAKVLKVDSAVSQEKVQPHTPFSLAPKTADVDTFLSEVVRPKLSDQNWTIQDVLPVTDSQALDVRATVSAPRTSVQYTMLYFNQGSIYRKQLLRACNELVKAHEILRTVFIEHDSTLLQVVLSDPPVASVTTQVADTDSLEQSIIDLCNSDIASPFPLGSPFLKIFHVQAKDGSKECLVLALSHAQYDGVSLPRLLRDLETLYTGGQITDSTPFSSYLSLTLNPQAQRSATAYWSRLLSGSSLSVLPAPTLQPTGDSTLDTAIFRTKPVPLSQPLEHITRATLLTAAWALVLSRRLGGVRDVVFGSVTSGRALPHTETVQGPCYQFTPVRVTLSPSTTARALLDSIQTQTAQSVGYDYLGFAALRAACTSWSVEGSTFFDSVVHHQDHDDFDTMSFAGGEARVDILNPHGDAPRPLKVVSYVKGGEFVVGVVGTKGGEAVVDELVDELVGAVRLLTSGSEESVLFA